MRTGKMPRVAPLSRQVVSHRMARALAVLGGVAMALQLYLSLRTQMLQGHSAAYGLFLYLGYFTILTNGFCAVVATAHARGKAPAGWVTTAAAVSIAMVGSLYFLLLRDQWDPRGLQLLVNVAMHYVIPPAFVLFWWVSVPHRTLVWTDTLRVLGWPVAYLAYVLLRGEWSGHYPYFFIDVARLGYPAALGNAAGISLAFALTGLAFVSLKRGSSTPAARSHASNTDASS